MTTSRNWYIFLITALVLVNAKTALVWAALEEHLDPGTIAPGQRTTLTLRLNYADLQGIDPTDEQSVPELNDQPFDQADGLILLDKGYERTRNQFVWRYAFTAYVPATYRLPPVEIRFGAQTFSTTARSLTVQGTRIENDEELRPEFEAASIPWEVPWRWIAAALGLVLLAGFYLWFRKQVSKKPMGVSNEFQTPEAWLREALEKYLQEHESASAAGVHAVEKYSEILRQYLLRRYVVSAPTMTHRELLHAVQKWESTKSAEWEALDKLFTQIEKLLFHSPSVSSASASSPSLTVTFAPEAVKTTQHLWLPEEKPGEGRP